MGLRIKTNVESLVAQRSLSENRSKLGDSLVKLSSGQRINKSADDAAGLAVSERIRARTKSLEVAKRNANDGISYIQVAEGGLNEVTNIVVRMRELASQAASDTIGNRERGFLDEEFQQLRQEVNRMVKSTEFNGAKVLQFDPDKTETQIFVGASNRADVEEVENDPDVLKIDLSRLEALGEALGEITEEGSDSMTVLAEDGAATLGGGSTHDLFQKIDSGLNAIADYRATLGSVQSRLNSTITNIDISSENLNAAMSRIRDVDYAAETAKLAQNRILTQAGISVLSQANSTPDLALALLR